MPYNKESEPEKKSTKQETMEVRDASTQTKTQSRKVSQPEEVRRHNPRERKKSAVLCSIQ